MDPTAASDTFVEADVAAITLARTQAAIMMAMACGMTNCPEGLHTGSCAAMTGALSAMTRRPMRSTIGEVAPQRALCMGEQRPGPATRTTRITAGQQCAPVAFRLPAQARACRQTPLPHAAAAGPVNGGGQPHGGLHCPCRLRRRLLLRPRSRAEHPWPEDAVPQGAPLAGKPQQRTAPQGRGRRMPQRAHAHTASSG